MKNRIFAILVVILMCFSMITPVFAATTAKINPEWEQTTINGNVYQIKYWHPKGYDKLLIQDVSGSYYTGVYTLLFYNDSTVFDTTKNDRMYITNGNAITMSISWNRYNGSSKTPEIVLDEIKSMLFGDDSAGYRNLQLTLWQCSNESTTWTGQSNLGDYEYDTTSETFEEDYSNWFNDKYGFYPPLAGADAEESTFMKGQYYAIFSQEAIAGDDIEDGNGRYRYQGYVDTVAPKDLKLTTIHELDGEKRGLVYVVISSDTKGDLIGFGSLANEGIFDWFTGILTKVGLWLDVGDLQRNNYDLIQGYIFYNENNNVNRYYFSTIQDACKFVLYGTAGAEPLYSEIGQTDYGYGYISCEFNNYDMNGHTAKTIPMEQYPMGRQEIILAQHDVKGPGRKFVYIDLNYYSRVSMIDSEKNLIINNEYMLPDYYEYIQGNETFENAREKSLYKPSNTYNISRTTTFPLYHNGLTDETGTWDIIYSTYSVYIVKQGQILDGDEKPPVIQIWKDKDGNEVTLNTETNELYKNGETDPYIYDPEKDKYVNSKGEEVDLKDYTNEILDWQDTINQYQDNFEKLADLIEDFTGFVNSSTEQVGEITDLLNAVMLSFPSIFRTLILFSFMALIFGRIIRRK